jgi:hypothetical protein
MTWPRSSWHLSNIARRAPRHSDNQENLMRLRNLMACAASLAACVGSANTASAFTANWNYSWGTTEPSSTDIGSSSNRTCFMTGLAGEFEPSYSPFSAIPSQAAEAGVRINPNTNNWEIYVVPRRGSLGVHARCVNIASEERAGYVTTGNGGARDIDLGAATASRRCFLASIRNEAYKDSQGVGYWGFAQTGSYVNASNPYSGDHVRIVAKVAPDFTSHWYATADNPSNKSQVRVTARCFNIAEDDGSWEWIAPNPGQGSNPLTSVTGATCGLTGIGGAFTSSSFSNGVSIVAAGNQFSMSTQDGKVGFATCMK